eukprot:329786-Pleurochrysis_carterae.AAC.3
MTIFTSNQKEGEFFFWIADFWCASRVRRKSLRCASSCVDETACIWRGRMRAAHSSSLPLRIAYVQYSEC